MYYNDARTRDAWYDHFCDRSMTVSKKVYTDDDTVETVSFPVKLEVCPVCHGRGRHVNPSIDCHGLSQDDFDEDPQFEEDYFSGVYDVTCNHCKGRRVSPVVDHTKLTADQVRALKLIDEEQRDLEDMRRTMRAEMGWGY